MAAGLLATLEVIIESVENYCDVVLTACSGTVRSLLGYLAPGSSYR